MASNKDKLIAAAQKFAEKGQHDKAIKEYRRVVDADPQDVRTWHKIADLYAKKGSTAEAVDTYERIATTYGDQGFYFKAVAVYKQILKIDGTRVDLNLKLAELYKQLGLLSDAMQQYELAVQRHEKEGRPLDAIEALRHMIEMDTENVPARVKLAESYSRQNLPKEAVEQFTLAAEKLKSQQRMDDYIKVAERIAWHRPEDHDLLKELAWLYIERQDARRALAKLQPCFKANPRDVNTLELLAEAFEALGQRPKTISVLKELATVYQEMRDRSRRDSVYRRILALEPGDADAAHALGQQPRTVTQTESGFGRVEASGLHQDTAVRFDGGSTNPVRAPAIPAPTSSGYGKNEPEEVSMEVMVEEVTEFADAEVAVEEVFEAEVAVDEVTYDADMVTDGEQHGHAGHEHMATATGDDSDLLIEDSVEFGSEADSTHARTGQWAVPTEAEHDHGFAEVEAEVEAAHLEEESASARIITQEMAPAAEHWAGKFQDDLDEAEFFSAQGLTDQAREILNNLLGQHPGHPAIKGRLAALDEADSAPVDTKSLVAQLGSELGEVSISKPATLELSRKSVVLEKQVGEEDFETHYDLGIAYKEMGLYEDAIKEFQLVMRAPGKEVFCRMMVGLCYLDKGKPAEAVTHLKQALGISGITERDELSVHYELGGAYEKLDNVVEAVAHLDAVFKKDSGFRDVRARLDKLRPRLPAGLKPSLSAPQPQANAAAVPGMPVRQGAAGAAAAVRPGPAAASGPAGAGPGPVQGPGNGIAGKAVNARAGAQPSRKEG